MSVVRGSDEDNVPGGFAVLAGRMSDSDDNKGGFVCIVTFDQSECALCEQALAWLVLSSALSVLVQLVDPGEHTNWEKSSWTLPS